MRACVRAARYASESCLTVVDIPYRGRPPVLRPLRQHAAALGGRAGRVREAVVVVGVEERLEVGLAIALLPAELTRDDELSKRHPGAGHQPPVDVRRDRPSRQHRLENPHVDVVPLVHGVVLGDERHVGVDERIVRVVVPRERVAGRLEDRVQLVEHDHIQVAHVTERDGREGHGERDDLDRDALRV